MCNVKCPKFVIDTGYILFLPDQQAEGNIQKVLIIGFKFEWAIRQPPLFSGEYGVITAFYPLKQH
jgi:hypothetical protein